MNHNENAWIDNKAKEGELKEEVFAFLDEVRESGMINMFGAAPHIRYAFPDVDTAQSRTLLKEWMETFGERHNG